MSETYGDEIQDGWTEAEWREETAFAESQAARDEWDVCHEAEYLAAESERLAEEFADDDDDDDDDYDYAEGVA